MWPAFPTPEYYDPLRLPLDHPSHFPGSPVIGRASLPATPQTATPRRRWKSYIWTDITEIVTRVPQELSVEAAQLAADIVIALNLNAHQDPDMRRRFGVAHALPGCLGPGGTRDAILGRADPPDDCPRDARSEAERARGAPVRCACPYLYNSADLRIDARVSSAGPLAATSG